MNYDRLVPPSQLGVAIPPMAEVAIIKALSVKAGDRFANMSAFLMALDQSSTVSAPRQQKTQPQPQPVKSRRTAAAPVSPAPQTPVSVPVPQPVPEPVSVRQPGVSGRPGGVSGGTAASGAPSSGGSSSAPSADEKRKKTILWGSIGIGALVVIAIIIIIAASGGKGDSSTEYAGGGGGGSATMSTAARETTSSVISPTTAAPETTGSETAAPTTAVPVGENVRLISVINASIDLPDSYVASDSDMNYTDAANDRAIYTDFTWNISVPVYSHQDIVENEDVYFSQYFSGEGITDYTLQSGGDIVLSGHNGFGRQVDPNEGGQAYTYYFIFLDGENDFGSYVVISKVRKDDSAGTEEVLNALDSFTILGEVSVSGYTSYQNEPYNVRFIYTTNDVPGGSVFDDNATYYMGLPGLTMTIADDGTVVEVIPPNSTISMPEDAFEKINPYYTGYGMTVGETETIDAGGITWTAKMSTYDDETLYRESIVASATINGYVFTVLTWATKENSETANRVLWEVIRSIRPCY